MTAPITWTVEGLYARDVAETLANDSCPFCQSPRFQLGQTEILHRGMRILPITFPHAFRCYIEKCRECQHYATDGEALQAFRLYHPDLDAQPMLKVSTPHHRGAGKSYALHSMMQRRMTMKAQHLNTTANNNKRSAV